LVTLCIALSTGYATGTLVSLKFFEPVKTMFQDGEYFHVEEEEEEAHAHGENGDSHDKAVEAKKPEADSHFNVHIHRTGSFDNAVQASSSV
jgi:hypothetical protein